ncbi:MAG: peptide/nickel transport system permease protein [Candidatus Magnetoglobus multicellularis str. Araruama]|uniref:Peptide/nickel transport system permease protein n=1 Tax=Candidatus Magnetoglobus multicellularis str. Araruama TaxID=890399 RepID=A0A1V1P8S4_9BACT|nr:MAG: peptide/nickel transport system permease protein [Candidatus Magnetoglobus multicellularis str. Araruama]
MKTIILSYLQSFYESMVRLLKNPMARIGVFLLTVFALTAAFAPILAPPKYSFAPYRMPHKGYSTVPKAPNTQNIFGTTSGQYDIYYGVVWGTRTAFKTGLFVVIVAALIGVCVGVISGYYGGWIDEIIMRFVDIVWTIPSLILAMALVVSFGRGLENIMLALALVSWRWYARVIRSEVLKIKEMGYVHAARIMGVSDIRIMIRHILPNTIYPIIIMGTLEMGSIVIMASFMSFVGLGAPKGYADWGQMVALARNYIVGPPEAPLKYWYTIFFPGGCIILFVLAWNLIGDALRDTFDPKQ